MKRISLLILLIVLSISSCKKDPQRLIIGSWEVKNATNYKLDEYLQQLKEKFNATDQEIQREKQRLEQLPTAFFPIGIVFTFQNDSVFYQQGTEGRWEYIPEEKAILIHFSSIDTAKFIIQKISNKKMTLIYEYRFTKIPSYFKLYFERTTETY